MHTFFLADLPWARWGIIGRRRSLSAALASLLIATTGCSAANSAGGTVSAPVVPAAAGQAGQAGSQSGGPAVGQINTSPQQDRITTPAVPEIAALVPEDIAKRGVITITGSSGSNPPLRFYADDDTTVIGSEVDLAYLFADVLGLKVQPVAADWAQNFVQIDSGKSDAFISNVTVTEERKQKYDFATYRNDNVAFETKAGSPITITGAKDVAGLAIGVASGTNQEKILVDWSAANEAAGLAPTDIKYFQNAADYYLALSSGRIQAYFGPNPSAAYHVAAAGQTQIAGVFSGAGDGLQGEIAVLTKKGNGLAKAFTAAINHTIANGTYAKVLARWNLTDEAITESRLNPPGLPVT